MVDWARARREAIRKQADLRRRLAAAERALADAEAMVTQAETEFDAASARFADAESALDEARGERARSRQERYKARQACERAGTTVARLRRRVDELGGRLGRMPPLTFVPGDVSGAKLLATWPGRLSRCLAGQPIRDGPARPRAPGPSACTVTAGPAAPPRPW